MNTIKLTCAQALTRYLCKQKIKTDNNIQPLFSGVFAIFGHGNVAGLGEALYQHQEHLPTYRAHNEQAMVHSAIAYAKAKNRRQMMACTTSIGPGATNMITACALAHVNRLPVLLLPGDTFANRRPDPVLQQIECAHDLSLTANDCFKPVSSFWDRITRPEQIINSLPQAMRVLTSPDQCGPAVISLCQDVQTQAYEYPAWFFEEHIHTIRQLEPDKESLTQAIKILKQSQRPLIIAGGGIHYAQACLTLEKFAQTHAIPVAFTQAGKGAIDTLHSQVVGSIGVTGNHAANELAKEADVILAIGTRLQDFTTGSNKLFNNKAKLIQLNVNPFDGVKHHALGLISDAKLGIEQLSKGLMDWSSSQAWQSQSEVLKASMLKQIQAAITWQDSRGITDAQVLGTVNTTIEDASIVVAAAGGLPGELHKNWICKQRGTYHLEYGFSCMGYEIAGALGVKMANPDKEVYAMVGDGSYMMLNSEINTSIMMQHKINIILLDNGGFGCINRLQTHCGSESFNNLIEHQIDFVQHAQSLGALAKQVDSEETLIHALEWSRRQNKTCVIVIKTTPHISSNHGGTWWDVAISEVSSSPKIKQAYQAYVQTVNEEQDV